MDDRDRIYGLLALLPNDISSAMKPDYELPEPKVYEHFSRAVIRSTKSLDFIHMGICQGRRGNQKGRGDGGGGAEAEASSFPSWVQDWRVSRRRLLGGFGRERTAVQAALDRQAEVE